MSWLNGNKIDAVAPRYKSVWNEDWPHGTKHRMQREIARSRATYKNGRKLRYKIMRDAFQGLRGDLLAIEYINNTMLKFSLRDQWDIPK